MHVLHVLKHINSSEPLTNVSGMRLVRVCNLGTTGRDNSAHGTYLLTVQVFASGPSTLNVARFADAVFTTADIPYVSMVTEGMLIRTDSWKHICIGV